MKTKKCLAVVGLAVSLMLGSVSGVVVHASQPTCDHRDTYTQNFPIAESVSEHTVQGGQTCVITTPMRRQVMICKLCGAVIYQRDYQSGESTHTICQKN